MQTAARLRQKSCFAIDYWERKQTELSKIKNPVWALRHDAMALYSGYPAKSFSSVMDRTRESSSAMPAWFSKFPQSLKVKIEDLVFKILIVG